MKVIPGESQHRLVVEEEQKSEMEGMEAEGKRDQREV